MGWDGFIYHTQEETNHLIQVESLYIGISEFTLLDVSGQIIEASHGLTLKGG